MVIIRDNKCEQTLVPVDLAVSLPPPDVVYRLPDDGDGQHEPQRPPVGVEVAYPQLGDELTARHDQEEQVQEEFELIPQQQRQKCEYVVFLVFDEVWRKLLQ